MLDKKTSPLLKNSVYLMLTTLSGAGSGFIFWFFGARLYSEENIGLAAAIISVIGFIAMFSRFGLDIGIIRYLSKDDDKTGMINSCLTIIFLAATIFTCIFLLNLEFLSPKLIFLKDNIVLAILLIVFTSANAILMTQSNVFVALRNTKYSFIQNLVAMLRIVILPLFVAWGLTGLYISYGLGLFVACIFGNFFIKKIYLAYKPWLTIKKNVVNRIFRFSFKNYIATIFEGFPTFLFPIIILNVLGAEQSAYFYIAWSLSSIISIVPKATSMSLFAEGLNNSNNFRHDFLKASKFIFSILCPLIIVFYIFGKNILSLFGTNYSDNAYQILWILSIANVPYSINILYITIKRIQTKMIDVILIYAFVGLFSIIGGHVFMQWYGLLGIAIAWIVGNGIVAIIILITTYINNRHRLLA